MSKYNLTKAETETIICWNAEDNKASIFTTDRRMHTKLNKLCSKCPEEYKLIKVEDVCGNAANTYQVKSDLISFRTPVKRVVSAEERARAAERLEAVRYNRRSARS